MQLAAGPIANRLGALARPHPAAPRRAPDRLGRRRAAAAGCIWCAGSVAAAGLVGTGTGLALAWLAAGAGSVLRWNGLNTLAVEAAPANRATFTSVFSACKLAGNAAAPLAWLPIYDVRISAAFLVAGATCLAIVSLIRTYPAASGDGTLPTR